MLNKILKSITFEEFTKGLKRTRSSNIFINTLFYGNIYINNLSLIKDEFLKFTPKSLKKNLEMQDLERVLNINGSYVYRSRNDFPGEVNHLIANVYQIQELDLKMNLISSILNLIFGNSFYYELRTLKQLGYIVRASKIVRSKMMVTLYLLSTF